MLIDDVPNEILENILEFCPESIPLVARTCKSLYSVITNRILQNFHISSVSLFLYAKELWLQESKEFYKSLAFFGYLDVLKFIGQDKTLPSEVVSIAIMRKHKDIVIFLLETCSEFDEDFRSEAAYYGNLQLVKYFHKNYPPAVEVGVDIARKSIRSGNLDVVKYTLKKHYFTEISNCSQAAEYSLEILKYLHSQGFPLTKKAYYKAASVGKIEILQYLEEQECPRGRGVCEIAALHGRLETLGWLVGRVFPLDSVVFANACNSNLETVKYLYDIKCPQCCGAPEMAITHKRKEILEFLLEHKCPISSSSTLAAAAIHDLKLLKRLVGMEVPLHHECMRPCIAIQDFEMVKYLKSVNCPLDHETRLYLTDDFEREKLKIFHLDGRCTWFDGFCTYHTLKNSPEMVDLLRS